MVDPKKDEKKGKDLKKKLEKWMNNCEKVGNVYNVRGSYYGMDNVPITIIKGKEIPNWSYVFVKHWKTSNPVIFQVINVHFDQPGAEYQDASISMGTPIKDPSMRKYKCRGLLVGEIEENGDIIPPLYPIEPEADVYLCPDDMVEFITQPQEDWCIRIGEIPELGIPVKVYLEPLVRQGLLITGAQGTGKTTALITLITRAALADPPLRFLILDWTGEFKAIKKALYKELIKRHKEEIEEGRVDIDEIQEKVKNFVEVIDWWKIYCGLFTIEDMRIYCEKFLIDVVNSVTKQDSVRNCLARAIKAAQHLTKDDIKIEVNSQEKTYPTTKMQAELLVDVDMKDIIPSEEEFEKWSKAGIRMDDVINAIRGRRVVIIDFSSKPEDFEISEDVEVKAKIANVIAREIWEIGSRDPDFGCVIVIDEAHRVCPESGYMDPIWQRLASEGGRNKIPLWIVARRLSLVSKKVTTELQQNFLCFNVEDIDRKRVEEDLGKSFADIAPFGTIPPLHCVIKSNGFRIPGQIIFTRVDVIERPAGVPLSKEVFERMEERAKKQYYSMRVAAG